MIKYEESNQYRLWDKTHQKILCHCDVIFHEAKSINNSNSNNKNKEEESEDKNVDKSDNKYVVNLATLKSSKLIIERC